MRFGVHTGPQHCTVADLRAVWRLADAGGFDWVEVVDRIGAYRDAGAARLVLALRAPFDLEALALFRERVMPAFAA